MAGETRPGAVGEWIVNRMVVDWARVVVEWDEVTGEATVGYGGERGWEVFEGLCGALGRVSGGWEVVRTLERRSTAGGVECFPALEGGSGTVWAWGFRFERVEEARLVAECVRAALGG